MCGSVRRSISAMRSKNHWPERSVSPPPTRYSTRSVIFCAGARSSVPWAAPICAGVPETSRIVLPWQRQSRPCPAGSRADDRNRVVLRAIAASAAEISAAPRRNSSIAANMRCRSTCVHLAARQFLGRLEQGIHRHRVRLPAADVDRSPHAGHRQTLPRRAWPVVLEPKPNLARQSFGVLRRDLDGAATGRGFVVLHADPLLQHLGGQRDAAGDAGRHSQLHQLLRIDESAAHRRWRRVFGAGQHGLSAGHHPGEAALAHGDFADLRQLAAQREPPLLPADESGMDTDRPAVVVGCRQLQVGKVASPFFRLGGQHGDRLLHERPRPAASRWARRPRRGRRCRLRGRGQVLGKEIGRHPQCAGQLGHRRVMPQPIQPNHPIGNAQGGRQLLRAWPRNHLVLGGIDHQHLAGPGPIAQRRRRTAADRPPRSSLPTRPARPAAAFGSSGSSGRVSRA